VVGCTEFGSITVCWDVLEFVILQCVEIYCIWLFYSVVGCSGFCSYTFWCDILDFIALQCVGMYWIW
jgi:hypothetical protein